MCTVDLKMNTHVYLRMETEEIHLLVLWWCRWKRSLTVKPQLCTEGKSWTDLNDLCTPTHSVLSNDVIHRKTVYLSPLCRGVWSLAWLNFLSSPCTAERLGCCTWCWQRWMWTHADWKRRSATGRSGEIHKANKGQTQTQSREYNLSLMSVLKYSQHWRCLPLACILAGTRTS